MTNKLKLVKTLIMVGLQYLLLRAQDTSSTAQSARVIEVCLPAHDGHMFIMCDILFNLKGYGVLHSLELATR
jgi:hypothetical protein